MLTKVTRNDLDEQVKDELDLLDDKAVEGITKADQALQENTVQNFEIDSVHVQLHALESVTVRSVEGILPDENGNVDLGDATAPVKSVNSQYPDGLGDVLIDDRVIPTINPYTNSQAMLNETISSIKDLTVMTVNNITPDGAGNVAITTVASANNADTLDNLNSTQFLRSDVASTAGAGLNVNNGLTVGSGVLNIDSGSLTIRDNLIDADYAYLLTWDGGISNKVGRHIRGNVSVGHASNSDWAAGADYAVNADTLDGVNGAAYARTDVEEWFDLNVNFKQGLTVSDGNVDIVNNNLYISGYVYPQTTTANKTYYVKIADSNYASNNPLSAYSTLRLGDIAIHTSDDLTDNLYRQLPAGDVDFKTPARLNDEGEECIFLLDIIENLSRELTHVHNEVTVMKQQIADLLVKK